MTTRNSLPDRETLLRLNSKLVERVKKHCDFGSPRKNDCWLRRSTRRNAKCQNLYGIIKVKVGASKWTNLGVHQVSYILQYGSIVGPNLQVRHQCHNPRCINPSHLLLGTAKENQADRKWIEMVVEEMKGKKPDFVCPHISLWEGWDLPEYQKAYEDQRKFAEECAEEEAKEAKIDSKNAA